MKLLRRPIRLIFLIGGLSALTAGGIVGWYAWRATSTIFEILTENRRLHEALANLTAQRQVGYAKVLEQTQGDGGLRTKFLFVITDPVDPTRRLLEETYEIEGDIAHFDALVVRFDPSLVMSGERAALFLWRRIYGEHTPPAQGEPIDPYGESPARYDQVFAEVDPNARGVFWDAVWSLTEDPQHLSAAGVDAVYGNDIYLQLRPGLIYAFKLEANGAFFPDAYPAL